MALTSEERHAARINEILAHRPAVCLVLDSGATHHMVGNPRILSNLHDLERGVAIRIADGFSLTATRIGDIVMRGIHIKDVYLVLGLAMNLISVPQLVADDIVCTFRKNYVDLSRGDDLIGGGIFYRRLYLICYLDATGGAAPAGAAASGNDHHAAFAITGDDNAGNTAIDWKEACTYTHESGFYGREPVIEPLNMLELMKRPAEFSELLKLTAEFNNFNLSDEAASTHKADANKSDFFYDLEPVIESIDMSELMKLTAQFSLGDQAAYTIKKAAYTHEADAAIDWEGFTYTRKSDFFYDLEPVTEPIDMSELLKLTAQFNLSDEAGGGVSVINKGTDGSVVGKAHLGSDGMPMADFLKVQLNEHCLNA
ncbi:hypothetical protein ACP4OV_002331 [Aristida adscensionis]